MIPQNKKNSDENNASLNCDPGNLIKEANQIIGEIKNFEASLNANYRDKVPFWTDSKVIQTINDILPSTIITRIKYISDKMAKLRYVCAENDLKNLYWRADFDGDILMYHLLFCKLLVKDKIHKQINTSTERKEMNEILSILAEQNR